MELIIDMSFWKNLMYYLEKELFSFNITSSFTQMVTCYKKIFLWIKNIFLGRNRSKMCSHALIVKQLIANKKVKKTKNYFYDFLKIKT